MVYSDAAKNTVRPIPYCFSFTGVARGVEGIDFQLIALPFSPVVDIFGVAVPDNGLAEVDDEFGLVVRDYRNDIFNRLDKADMQLRKQGNRCAAVI